MIEVNQLCGQIYLGKQGENLARIVYFDEPTSWKEVFGEGTCELIHQRKGDISPYPVMLEKEGDRWCWKITSADTAMVGNGKCELHYLVDNVVVKSKIWQTKVHESLAGDTIDPPEPHGGWVDEVLKAAKVVVEASSNPPVIGKNKNWWIWDSDSEEYVDSGTRAEGEPGKDGKDGKDGADGKDGKDGIDAAKNIVEGVAKGSLRVTEAQEVTEDYGIALGPNCYAGGLAFTAGLDNNNTGYGGAMFGTRNVGKGWGIFVAGQDNNVDGSINMVLGSTNRVKKTVNFVTGASHYVEGDYNAVIGTSNKSYSNNNVLAGKNLTAYTPNNVMMGYQLIGAESGVGQVIAIGNKSYAQFDNVIVIGNGLVASKAGQVVLGQYNTPSTKAVVIGNGYQEIDASGATKNIRQNALEIDKNGNAKFFGSVTDGSGNVLGGSSSPLDWYDVTISKDGWQDTTGSLPDGGVGIYCYKTVELNVKNAVADYYPTAIFKKLQGVYSNLRDIDVTIQSIKDKTVTLYFSTPTGSTLNSIVRENDISVKIGLVRA